MDAITTKDFRRIFHQFYAGESARLAHVVVHSVLRFYKYSIMKSEQTNLKPNGNEKIRNSPKKNKRKVFNMNGKRKICCKIDNVLYIQRVFASGFENFYGEKTLCYKTIFVCLESLHRDLSQILIKIDNI